MSAYLNSGHISIRSIEKRVELLRPAQAPPHNLRQGSGSQASCVLALPTETTDAQPRRGYNVRRKEGKIRVGMQYQTKTAPVELVRGETFLGN